ncbi:MAG: vWA domain-containing protein [Erysipelotrichaceae bacterium]|nr:vWA domain-containing protein [Erysipelotrichaceae bacterium]
MKKDLTEVVFIIDKSGSMSGLEADVVGGINSTLKKQKDEDGECLVSLVLFDTKSEVVYDRVPIEEIRPMEVKDYVPSGCTALVDALASSIKYIKKVHRIIREEDRPEKTLFVITTDGMENASHKYDSDQLKKMVSQQSEEGWQFIYLAANIDAVETGAAYGFKREATVDFVCDAKGNGKVYDGVGRWITANRRNLCEAECDASFNEVREDYKERAKR